MQFPLDWYDLILVNSSAGKDSQVSLDVVVAEARRLDLLRRIVVVHADLGRAEWEGTKELAQEHAAHYGLRCEVVQRRKRPYLLDEIKARGKWPDSVTRYCTSYMKREPCLALMTRLVRELHECGRINLYDRPARLLNVYGFRAEESPRRRKLPAFQLNKRATNKTRRVVYDWLPIQGWTEAQVWERIRQAGTRPHRAYSLGMPRLSCRFCVFAPKGALMIAARHNPEVFQEYLAAEKEMGHTFRKSLSLVEVDEALKRGEVPDAGDGAWNM